MTGVETESGRWRISLNISQPSILGIDRSSRMKVGLKSSSAARPVSALTAVRTFAPIKLRYCDATARLSGSSSMTSTAQLATLGSGISCRRCLYGHRFKVERQHDSENAALADFTLDADRAAHQHGQLADDGQAQAGAAVGAFGRA